MEMAASSALERKLRARPDRQWLHKDGCCTKRSILKAAGTLVQCQMASGEQNWDWRKTCDVRDVWKIASGYGVEVLLTSNEQLVRFGDFQPVEYEQVRLRKRNQKRRYAHDSSRESKMLPPRDVNMILEANYPRDQTSCIPISVPTGHRVRQIACGLSHCAVITESDVGILSLLTMGHGLYGQLGLGEIVHAPSLTPLTSSPELLLEIIAIGSNDGIALRCGPFATSLLIRNTSSVWYWGLLPCADSPTKLSVQDEPTLFPWIDPSVRVTDIAMGMEHLTLLSTTGSVFTWGIGYEGQLGLELTVRENAHQSARQVQFYDANVKVESISSGWYHNVAISTDKRVFAWGSNRYGACGAATKFVEYFHPVLVALPPNLKKDLSSKWSVHCCGHTSGLLAKRSYGAVQRMLVWGVYSNKHASLLPVEAGGLSLFYQDFVHAQVGFGCVRWIVQHHEANKAETPLFQLTSDCSSPLVNAVRTFYCESDETVTLPLKIVPGFEASEPFVLDINDVIILSLPTAKACHTASTKAKCRVRTIETENSSDGAGVIVEIDPMCEGEYCIQVAINGLFVLGFPMNLNVSAKSSNTSVIREPTVDLIEIVGISVTDRSSSEKSSLVNLRWFGMKSRRLRVTSADELVILARVSTDCFLRMECHGDDVHSRAIPLIPLTSNSCSAQFVLAVFSFPIPASYDVAIVSSDLPNDQRNLLHVDCCAPERELKNVVLAHKRIVDRYFASAFSMKSPVSAKFALFMSSLLNHEALRLVVARSPWIGVDPESDFDLDRFAHEQQTLKTSNDPFVLWNSILGNSFDNSHANEKDILTGCTLDELMPTWLTTVGNVCYAPFKTLVNGDTQDTSSPNTSIEQAKDCLQEASEQQKISRQVSQSPYEFLIRTSSTISIGQTSDLCDDDIHSWLDHHGDLQYTPRRHDGQYAVEIYLDEICGIIATTVKGNPVALWKRQLHATLWSLVDAHDVSMAGLFHFLAAWENADSDTEPTITYQSFVRQTQALGFGRSMAKQQWYALFVNLQSMSLTARSTIPLHVFRTFLVDPFHEIFWKQYLRSIKSRSASLEACTQLVLQYVGAWTDERAGCIPWKDLATRLHVFNFALVTSSSTSMSKFIGVSDYCRLLYRFDVHCDGFIPVNLVVETMICGLKSMFEEAQSIPEEPRPSKRKSAVTSKWRPDVEKFTTTDAVRKLFVARAKAQQERMPPTLRGSKSDAVLELMSSGNTRLAHIRSLPVSRMLREGTYFRPQQTHEAAAIAEHSF